MPVLQPSVCSAGLPRAFVAASERAALVSTAQGRAWIAVRGGDSGDAAVKAGDHLDLLSKRLGDGLKAFSEAVRAAKNAYGETDYSTSVDFKGFSNAIEGKK